MPLTLREAYPYPFVAAPIGVSYPILALLRNMPGL